MRIKKKKLPLNQHHVQDQTELKKLPPFANRHNFTRESKLENAESNVFK